MNGDASLVGQTVVPWVAVSHRILFQITILHISEPRKHKPLQNVLNKTSIKRIFVNSRKRLHHVLMNRFVNPSHKTFVKCFVNAYYTSY